MSKRYIVRRISNSLCELTYPTPKGPERLVRYTRRDTGGYVWRDGQQAMEQGRNRRGHTLRCGAHQDLAKKIAGT